MLQLGEPLEAKQQATPLKWTTMETRRLTALFLYNPGMKSLDKATQKVRHPIAR